MRLLSRSVPLAVLSLVVAVGCSEATEPKARWAPAERIAGTWNWVHSLDVKTGQTATPETTGSSGRLTFAALSEREGTFVFERPGAEPITGSFGIASEDAPGNDFITVSTSFPFITRSAWVAAGADSLRLDGGFEGGFNSTYARVVQ
jgi:hypothetical protein